MKNRILSVYIQVFICCFFQAANLFSAPIFSHSGSSNPLSEGFSLFAGGSPSLNPVFGDQGSNAWSIQALNSATAIYRGGLTTQQSLDAQFSGWKMSLSLRVQNPVGRADGVFATFGTGAEFFSLRFGIETNGNALLQLSHLPNAPTYSLTTSGLVYHKYDLISNGGGLASLFVDDVLLLSGISGTPTFSSPAFAWGSSQQAGNISSANWRAASIEIIPEPTALTPLSLLAGLLLLAKKSRTKMS